MEKRLGDKIVAVALVLLIALVMIFVATEASAEDGSLIQWHDDQYVNQEDETVLCVLRPQISLRASKNSQLKFGDELILLEKDGNRCYVRTEDGREGYVETGYVAYVHEKVYLKGHVNVSPKPGMDDWDFGSKAGGWRISEMALVLFYEGDYMYVVTDEGMTGYVYRHDKGIVPYEEYQEEEEDHG